MKKINPLSIIKNYFMRYYRYYEVGKDVGEEQREKLGGKK